MESGKNDLRKQALQGRLALFESTRLQYTQQIVDQLIQLPCLQAAATILAYLAVRGEVSLVELCQWVLDRGQTLTFPRSIRESRTIEVVPVVSLDQMTPGEYGILEPAADRLPLDPAKLDVILVPGVVFDERGGRLGYGAGYYDRLFDRTRLDAVKIGVGFEVQLAACVPQEVHDVRMDAVVTERRILVFNPAKFRSNQGEVWSKE